MDTAICRYCGQRFNRSGIARHIAACSKRKAPIKDPGTRSARFHHLQIADKDTRLYWLYVLAVPDVTLGALDEFLRSVWLECCYHMSAFTVGESQYVSEPDAPLGDTFYSTKLADLPEGTRIYYDYDFGSTTSLTIRRLKPVEHPIGEQQIEIAARNDPPEFACRCGRNAIVAETRYWDMEYLCSECLAEYGGDESSLTPLTNSPRLGVCGYYRGQGDIDGDYPGFEQAQGAIDALPAMRHEEALEGGSPEERAAVLEQYLRLLTGRVEGRGVRRAAAFIDRHFEHFAEQLRRIVVDTIERYRADLAGKPTNPAHVVSLFLLSRRSDAELFTLVAEGLSREREFLYVWNGALDEPRVRRALFASLCRESPQALVSAIAAHEDDPIVRYSASNALLALYMHGLVDRQTVVAVLNELAERAVENEDFDLADLVAGDCLVLYPDDMIRTVQRLHSAGLLDDRHTDYLALVREILESDRERHFAQLAGDDFYSLLDDPMAALEDALDHTTSFRPRPSFPRQAALSTASQDVSHLTGMAPATDKSSRNGGTVVRATRKVGRNEPCPCGSGRKYKHCCGR